MISRILSAIELSKLPVSTNEHVAKQGVAYT
jgi:hypothetical protein